MNRNSFLKVSAAAWALLAGPMSALAKFIGIKRVSKGVKVDAGKDRFEKPISLYEGDTFYTKISTADTDGDLYVFESTRSKKGGPPLHYHFTQDEFWYVLEGEFLFKIGDETFTVKAGDTVFGPRMIPHAFSKVNEGNAKLLMAFQPAGQMEEHFKARSQGAYSKLTPEELDKIQQAHGFKTIGPALTYDKTTQ